jgi:hypothetical protein
VPLATLAVNGCAWGAGDGPGSRAAGPRGFREELNARGANGAKGASVPLATVAQPGRGGKIIYGKMIESEERETEIILP